MANTKDLCGLRFGKLVVIRPTEAREQKSIVWECRCDCGEVVGVSSSKLLSGRKKSCGCLRKDAGRQKAAEITGQRFGRLTAIRPTNERRRDSVVWECRCDCGNTAYYPVSFLKSKAMSCGCVRKENNQKKMYDVTGIRFGRLTGIAPTQKRDQDRSVIWKWKCDCGNCVEKSLNDVSTGSVQSCGCLREEALKGIYEKGLKNGYIMGTNLYVLRQEEARLRADNVSGTKGVYYLAKENRYVAFLKFRGVHVYKRYHTLEQAIEARHRMKAVHEEFLDWWDSLTDEQKKTECANYESEKATQAALLKKKIADML